MITIKTVLGGNLDAGGFNIANAGTITSTGFTGNLTGNVTGLVNGIDLTTIAYHFNNFDAGSISGTANNMIDFLIVSNDQDFGTVTNPSEFDTDLGAIAI